MTTVVTTPDGQEARMIPGYPGYYVDALGRDWTTKRRNGKPDGPLRQRKPGKTWQGYLYVRVYIPNPHRAKRFLIHRQVLTLFRGPAPEGKPFALHNDDDRNNNALANLRWGSPQDNNQDQNINGTVPFKGMRYLTDDEAFRLAQAAKSGVCCRELATEYGVSAGTVKRYKRGYQRLSWKKS